MTTRKSLLNYTTEVRADKTAGEIMALLIKAGASSIITDYQDGVLSALRFVLPTARGPMGVELPANVEAVYNTLEKHRRQGRVQPRYVNRDQAARVAWRIVKDWLEAQLAIIETEMVSVEQVLFPYMLAGNDRTVYQLWAEHRLALPSGEAEIVIGEVVEQ